MSKIETKEICEKNSNIGSSRKSKQENQSIWWFMTLNNYTNIELENLETFFTNNCEKVIAGFEVGSKCNTPHIQGYFQLKKKMRKSELIKIEGFKRAWLEAGRNKEALIKYCQKEGKDFFRKNIPKPLKIISELRDWQKNLYEKLKQEPDDRKIIWICDEKGGCGKSQFVKYMVSKHNAIFCNGGKCKDIINLCYNADFDKTNIVFWDLPRNNKGKVSYDAIECIKNGMICNTKYETGIKLFNSPHIVIFSNYMPEDLDNLSADRWDITRI